MKFSNCHYINVETDSKKSGQDQKLSTNKKSTIFEVSSWNLVKRTTTLAHHFDQVWWWYLKNCRFFIISQIFWHSSFLWISLYLGLHPLGNFLWNFDPRDTYKVANFHIYSQITCKLTSPLSSPFTPPFENLTSLLVHP